MCRMTIQCFCDSVESPNNGGYIGHCMIEEQSLKKFGPEIKKNCVHGYNSGMVLELNSRVIKRLNPTNPVTSLP